MEQTFLTGINIENVRHLSNILIPLDKDIRKMGVEKQVYWKL